MARLVFESVKIYTGSIGDTLVGEVKGVRTDDMTMSKEGNVVTVDNGREINESFNGEIELRSRNTTFDGGGDILAASEISTDGTQPTETYLEFVGRSNSHDIETGPVYLMGMEDYSNGRVETMLRATLTEVDQSDVMTSNSPSGS